MAKKPGRNDPCPCGSGKKYKRCCLPSDEAASRAQQQTLLDGDLPYGDTDFAEDADVEELFEIVEDIPALDVRTITSVCYTRGFVDTLSDLGDGRNVRVTAWDAPQIPQEVLDSIDREALDALEGEWGDSKAADPIQVDVIDVETESDVISLEVFNRATVLLEADAEEMQRIHRVCEVLEAAAQSGRDLPVESIEARDSGAADAVERRDRAEQPAADFDWSGLMKEHRRQGGTCALCGKAIGRRAAQKHVAECAPAYDAPDGATQRLVQVRAVSRGLPAYWLDIELKAGAKLEALDALLREIWLECCGHLSAFRIGAVDYFSHGYDFGFGRTLADFRGQPPRERSMGAKLCDVLPPIGERFGYDYDFGSTTTLELKVLGERIGRFGRESARLLARNTPPLWPCAICGQPAEVVCPYCIQEDANAFVCKRHRRQHACGEGEGFLPVVNSPRMGVCGYTGES